MELSGQTMPGYMFVTARVRFNPEARLPMSELYGAYKKEATERGAFALSATAFNRDIEENCNACRGKYRGERVWRGLEWRP